MFSHFQHINYCEKRQIYKIFQSARHFDNTQKAIKVIQMTESQLLGQMMWWKDWDDRYLTQ